mmetsp:Transcript_4410/g.14703  ORF Transcript_4410/g.14703 Transcript_4410/m.14703 type:complete len:225 (+) Transcript_4410:350-1024(+)
MYVRPVVAPHAAKILPRIMRCTLESSMPMQITSSGSWKQLSALSAARVRAGRRSSKTVRSGSKRMVQSPSRARAHWRMIQPPSPAETRSVLGSGKCAVCSRCPRANTHAGSASETSLWWSGPGRLITRTTSWSAACSISVRMGSVALPYLTALEMALRCTWKSRWGSATTRGSGSGATWRWKRDCAARLSLRSICTSTTSRLATYSPLTSSLAMASASTVLRVR